ncbi:hypothetical protein ACH5RR_025117 [Cinchona calisaya]|uniref:Uncharacterized protein n=1 Tax=Cinchona calisaya TaxID=153742 RepID=A0ABD2Z223_9GENT
METDCQDSSTETPTKRIKIQTPTPENSSPPSLLISKGKSKLEFDTNCCGICLSEAAEDDNSVSRGYIDSCDHYFCFVCIMEWAKVESKCPLCKRRFSSIRRPAKPPIFPSDRLVRVPVRDQVYYYSGNATTGPFDPYAEAKCSVCQSSGDENLLLLCDLCDSAAHTYCVGLGATVPEGDWFCHDCTLLKDEQNKGEIDSDCTGHNKSGKFNESSLGREDVSIFDIVREPHISVVVRSSTRQFSVHPARNLETSSEDDTTVLDSSRPANTVQGPTKLTARTLRRCRNVHDRIQALRDNWNCFRRGSLSFSSSKTNNECIAETKPEIGVDSVQPRSTSSSSMNLILDNGSSSTSHNRDSGEIDKAWKMLDMAKSIEKRKSTVCQAPNKLSLKHLPSNGQHGDSENLTGIKQEKHYHCPSVGKDSNKQKPPMLERQDCPRQGFQNGSIGSAISPSPIYCHLISSQDVQCPNQDDFCRNSPQNISVGSPFIVSNKYHRSICACSSVEPAPAASNLVRPKIELQAPSSSGKKEPFIEKGARQKIPVDPNATKGNYDAKSEIQSLVKLNLKLLTKDKKLEINVFKEVARLATHSILAACGLEHPKPGIHPIPRCLCCHDDSQQFRRSTLMPNSCRECFYVFVKDIVNTLLLEKIR